MLEQGRRALAGELRKHVDLLGWAGLDKLSLPVADQRAAGRRPSSSSASGLSFEISGFLSGKGSFGLANEVVTFTATATGQVPGLATITVPIERKEDGSLAGKVTVDLTIKGFTGQVEASYDHGVVDVIGTVSYANEKFDGSVTIAATDKDNAKALTAAHTPGRGEDRRAGRRGCGAARGVALHRPPPAAAPDASGAAPGSAVAAKPGKRVLVGWGTVNVRLAEWLSGEATVVVDAEGDVTIVGKITPKMTKPLFEQRDYKYALPKLEVRAAYGVPVVGNVFVFANIGLEALAKLGPATLTNMEMTGTYSTKPSVLQSFGLTGTLNISAFAGLRLTARGRRRDRDPRPRHQGRASPSTRSPASGGTSTRRPRIGYREVADPQAGKKGEFYIGGHLDIAAQPFLAARAATSSSTSTAPGGRRPPTSGGPGRSASSEYPLPGEFGIGADVEHVLGSGKMPEIQFGKVDFNAVAVHDRPRRRPRAAEEVQGRAEEGRLEGVARPAGAAPAPAAAPAARKAAADRDQPAHRRRSRRRSPRPAAARPRSAARAARPQPRPTGAEARERRQGQEGRWRATPSIVKKEKNHPEDEAQISQTLAQDPGPWTASPRPWPRPWSDAKWEISASINTKPKSTCPGRGAGQRVCGRWTPTQGRAKSSSTPTSTARTPSKRRRSPRQVPASRNPRQPPAPSAAPTRRAIAAGHR